MVEKVTKIRHQTKRNAYPTPKNKAKAQLHNEPGASTDVEGAQAQPPAHPRKGGGQASQPGCGQAVRFGPNFHRRLHGAM